MGFAQHPETGDVIEFEDDITPDGVNHTETEAESKGWTIVHKLQNPKTMETINVEKAAVKEALDKGWKLPVQVAAQKDYEKTIKDEVGAGTAALTGLAQGASFGFADELTGAANVAKGKLLGEEKTAEQLYTEGRDKARLVEEAAQEKHPVITTGAELASGMLVPGLGIAKSGAKGLAKVGQLAVEGAGLGGLSAAGASEGNLSDVESAKQLGKDISTGALVGGALGGVVGGASEGLSKLGAKTQDFAGEQALKSFKPTAAMRSKLSKTAPDIGVDMLKEGGIVNPIKSNEKIVESIAEKLSPAGKGIGNFYNELDDVAKQFPEIQPKPQDIIDALRAKQLEYNKLSADRGKSKAIESIIEDIESVYQKDQPITFGQLRQEKTAYQSKGYEGAGLSMKQSAEVNRDVGGVLRNVIEQKMQPLTSKADAETLANLNKRFKTLSIAEDLVERQTGKGITAMDAGAAVFGSPIHAAAIKLLNNSGNAALAQGAYQSSRAMNKLAKAIDADPRIIESLTSKYGTIEGVIEAANKNPEEVENDISDQANLERGIKSQYSNRPEIQELLMRRLKGGS